MMTMDALVAKYAKNTEYAINAVTAEYVCGANATNGEPEECQKLRDVLGSLGGDDDDDDDDQPALLQQKEKAPAGHSKKFAKKRAVHAEALVQALGGDAGHGHGDDDDDDEDPEAMCQGGDDDSTVDEAENAKCAIDAVNAKFAKNALNAEEAMNAENATDAKHAMNAVNAKYAECAETAKYALNKVPQCPAPTPEAPPPAVCDPSLFEEAGPNGGCVCMPDYERAANMSTGACTPTAAAPKCNPALFEEAGPTGGCVCIVGYERATGMLSGACMPKAAACD